MAKLLIVAIFGLIAQLIDGALGMAYGVTSTTLLLAFGYSPAIASASVHLAELGTTLMSGAAHSRFGNVDWRAVGLLGVPGAVGAFFGAHLLTAMSGDVAKPVVSTILLLLGAYVLLRFSVLRSRAQREVRPVHGGALSGLGVFAGALDAVGGGGWGPVATPTLISSGRMEPRKVIGSVDTSEFLVALAASIGFLTALGHEALPMGIVTAMLLGGLVAAPIAAWIVQKVPPRIMGTLVGMTVLLTNAKVLLEVTSVPNAVAVGVVAVLALVGIGAVAVAVSSTRRDRMRRTATADQAVPA